MAVRPSMHRRALKVSLSDAQMRQLDEVSPHSLYYPSWFNHQLRDPRLQQALAPTTGSR